MRGALTLPDLCLPVQDETMGCTPLDFGVRLWRYVLTRRRLASRMFLLVNASVFSHLYFVNWSLLHSKHVRLYIYRIFNVLVMTSIRFLT